MSIWDQNMLLGDAQLMALASWLRHEEIRAEEVKFSLDGDLKEPLWIIIEYPPPSILTTTHDILAKDPKIEDI